MSRNLIEDYYNRVEKIKQYSGSRREMSLRSEFANLLNQYCEQKNLLLVPELDYKTKKGNKVTPDGTVKDALRLDWGYWESKDEYDDLEEEIDKKLEKGYPDSNVIFEDSITAVLIQQGSIAKTAKMANPAQLNELLLQFVNYQRPEIRDFQKAIEKFKEDLPTVLDTLRNLIETEGKTNHASRKSRDALLKLCQETINPKVTVLDIREMLIQHILTEEIFISIFNEAQFHRENNIAKELQKVADSFFFGKLRKDTLSLIDHYYLAIKAAASNIENHHEKQKFLKVLYENFYRTYNPKAADRLGIFYTPNEIVQFIIKSVNYLLEKHFGRLLNDQDVEILDPATGTGTFVTELIEQIPAHSLDYKYKKEIYCNEVAILPYYIANLNIEFTYKQKMGDYQPFENICFVDTLDNMGFSFKNKQTTLFDIGDENLARIKRQNRQRISVIIGNPPYNANQLNENENNKNRSYPLIDKRIKETYVKNSNATKTKVYDMYARFYRWASDRLYKNGIIAFITNRSYIDSYTYDGFRKQIQKEFNHVYIIDTKSDVRANPKISGTTHNVFGIQTGVAVMFLVRKESSDTPCCLEYFSLKDEQKKEEKLQWFATTHIKEVPFDHLTPDKTGNWVDTERNDFHKLLPLVSEDGKNSAIYGFYAIGVSTNRDEWVFDFNGKNLNDKVMFFVNSYNTQLNSLRKQINAGKVTSENIGNFLNYDIKWSRALKDKILRKSAIKFDESAIMPLNYRPYVEKLFYSDKSLSDFLTANHYKIFGEDLKKENKVICFSGVGSSKPFACLASRTLWSLDFLEKTQGVPLFTYNGNRRINNITNWGIESFRKHFNDDTIDGEAIFYYVYAILNSSNYRIKYAINLTRELPRIPLKGDFWKISAAGKHLFDLHVGYQQLKSYDLKKAKIKAQKKFIEKSVLNVDHENRRIVIDSTTIFEGIPAEVWDFRLGNRSAVEWVIDQYKRKEPKDVTVRTLYYKYDFEDYKTAFIDLLKKIVQLSILNKQSIEEIDELINKP
jgi:predicted helicase